MTSLIGHAWAAKKLFDAIDRDALGQSHLFVGPASIGKSTLARAVARRLLMRGAADAGRAAALVEANRHPDLSWLEAEPGESIKVEAIRELLHTLSLAPVESRYRVAVLVDAHLATESSKNAILKTLEEPNTSVVIILIAPSVEAVLPTIASRCQVLNLRPVPTAQIVDALRARAIPDEQARSVARLARGRVGWALQAAQEDSRIEHRKAELDQLVELLAGTRTQRLMAAESLAKRDLASLEAMLDQWQLFWRDAVYLAGGSRPLDRLLNQDYQAVIAGLAEEVSEAGLSHLMRQTADAQRQLRQRVNPRLTLDCLMLALPVRYHSAQAV